MAQYYIKHKADDETRWSFMTSNGGTSYAKIHAAPFEEGKVDEFLEELRKDNPDFVFKKVRAGK